MNFAKLQRLGEVVGLCLTLALSACGGGGGGDSTPAPATPPAVVSAPSAPVITVNPSTPAPTVSVNFSATSTDPAGLAITYEWDFGDASAKVKGPAVTHPYAVAGSYTVTVTATNSSNKSAINTKSVSVAIQTPTTPSISSSASPAIATQNVTFSASATDPGGLPLTYTWSFGDGLTAAGNTVTHAYASSGAYNVNVAVSNGTLSSHALFVQSILVNTPNVLVADCTGANCGATDASTYSGTGIGVWKYVNNTATQAQINININGVSAGKKATLIFSNAQLSAGTTNPSGGTLLEQALQTQTLNFEPNNAVTHEDAHDAAHTRSLELNRAAMQMLTKAQGNAKPRAIAAEITNTKLTPRVLSAPAVGATRSWNDTHETPAVVYTIAVDRTCSTVNGRNVVFWLDPNATLNGNVTSADMTTLAARFCGATGSFAQLVGIMGEAWGTGGTAKFGSQVLSDSPLQDINVVIIDVPSTSTWAGYFSSMNNVMKTVTGFENSNEAIAFNINASQIKVAGVNFISSTLIHEATHMINFYQRYVLKGVDHDTWLEETTAMMSEDTLANAVFGVDVYSKISNRTKAYLSTGGDVDYVNWTGGASNYYNMGGAFGAYLNRRYGISMLKQLVSSCNDGSPTTTSYACVDTLIKNNGGAGFTEDFTRFGTSLFARVPPTAQPAGYGYPTKTDGGYTYSAFNPALWAVPSTPLGNLMGATTHRYYVTDTVAAGKTSYTRNAALVPANTTLTVVIQ